MIRIRQVKIPVKKDSEEYIKTKLKKILNISSIDNYKIIKKSIDARDKNNILYVYEIDIETKDENKILKNVRTK